MGIGRIIRWERKAPAVFFRLSSLALAVVFFSSCAQIGGRKVSSQTYYLGPDGRIVVLEDRVTTDVGSRGGLAAFEEPAWEWNDDANASGPPRIVINLSEQRAYYYRGNTRVGMTPISSGREGYNTPTGQFSVIQKNANHVSNLYGDYVDAQGVVVQSNVGVHRDPRPPGTRFRGAPMPYFMRVTGAVGMHAGYLPGYPASHGCIRLPMGAARKFFQNTPMGTPVLITH